MINFKYIFMPLIFSGLLLGGCASKPPVPQSLIMEAEQKVQSAKDDQAYQYAPLEIKNAEMYLKDAESANQKEEIEKAKRNYELAVVNAEHAIAKTRTEKAEKAAKEINKGLDTLKQESSY